MVVSVYGRYMVGSLSHKSDPLRLILIASRILSHVPNASPHDMQGLGLGRGLLVMGGMKEGYKVCPLSMSVDYVR
jgi:hypothetical protein